MKPTIYDDLKEMAAQIDIKICIVGEPEIGKTTIIHRLATGKYESDYGRTKLSDIQRFKVVHRKAKFNVAAWDTPGNKEARVANRLYYRHADAIILTYDISNAKSYEEVVGYWTNEVKEKAPDDAVLILVGNKSDLPMSSREVTHGMGQAAAKSQHISFIEVSALAPKNMDLLIQKICSQLLDKSLPSRPSAIDLSASQENNHSGGCC